MNRIALLQVDRPEWEKELKRAIELAADRHVGGAQEADIAFVAATQSPDLVLYLGSPQAASDPGIQAELTVLVNSGIRVLPVVSDLRQFSQEVPDILRPINGLAWTSAAIIAEEVLRHLGLTERDRRVFLSYLRREATPLAHQLYDELHRRRFSVFLDSFEIDHGLLVQGRIEQALHETAFVLLLYSPSVELSEWVEKEINFALTQRLGLLALAYPGAAQGPAFRMAPSDRREPLQAADLTPEGTLTPAALDQICLLIEREHADQFRARRERLLADLAEALGTQVIRVGTHSLLYQGSQADTLLRVNPRAPDARDLYLLDQDCQVRSGPRPLRRMLVAVKGGYEERRELTHWVCQSLQHQVHWQEPQALCADPSLVS